VISQDAKDVPCEGCPGSVRPAPNVSINHHQIDTKSILDGLPDGTTKELQELKDVVYSKIWSVDVGKFAEGHLAQIVETVPGNLDRISSHADGSLEYEKGLDDFEPPSPIDGYERDSENLWLFRPLWESCTWRHYTTMFKQKCQCIDVLAKCSVSGHWVKYEDCLKCQSRLPILNQPFPKKKTRATLRLPDLNRSSK